MAHPVPPPDFRYVGLLPGSRAGAVAMALGVVGIGAFGVAMLSHHPVSFGLTVGGGVFGALALARTQLRGRFGAREVAMAIVPWGVVVEPDAETRIFRWPAIRKVAVEVAHAMDGGTPAVISSTVLVKTERELFSGRIPGPAGLEGLTANLEAYAEEAARPASLDLEGLTPAGDGATEPVIAALIHAAEDLCGTSRGAAILGLPPGGYRHVATRVAAPETLSLLRAALEPAEAPPADPRPLAALVAGLLGARALVPELLRLSVSPHPLVAAVAKAAAMRLGAPPNRAGALDEVALFLFPEDHERLIGWAFGPLPEG